MSGARSARSARSKKRSGKTRRGTLRLNSQKTHDSCLAATLNFLALLLLFSIVLFQISNKADIFTNYFTITNVLKAARLWAHGQAFVLFEFTEQNNNQSTNLKWGGGTDVSMGTNWNSPVTCRLIFLLFLSTKPAGCFLKVSQICWGKQYKNQECVCDASTLAFNQKHVTRWFLPQPLGPGSQGATDRNDKAILSKKSQRSEHHRHCHHPESLLWKRQTFHWSL